MTFSVTFINDTFENNQIFQAFYLKNFVKAFCFASTLGILVLSLLVATQRQISMAKRQNISLLQLIKLSPIFVGSARN